MNSSRRSSHRSSRSASRRARLTVIAVAAVIVATVVVSLGSNLWGSTYLLRSDTVFNHAPWSETVPVDFSITPITGTDPVDSGFPAHVQFFERANDGDFAAWNPYPSGGVPLGSVPNTGPFDPLNLPFLFLADGHAPAAGKVLELALAIGGMVLFLRCFKVGYPVALFGGLIYAFNGFQTFWTNWPQSHVGALIPWLFWATERLLAARARRGETSNGPDNYGPGIYGAAIAVIVAIMFLVGFPAVTLFALAALAVYVIARSLASSRGLHSRSLHSRSHIAGRTSLNLLAVIFFAVLGAGLAAWQLAPSVAQLDVVDTEYRQQTTQDRLPTGALLTTSVPNVIGSYALDRTAAQHNFFETQSFIGAGALVLAAVALLRRRARNLPRWLIPTLAGMTAIAVVLVYFGGPLLALAQQLPVIGTNRIGRLRAVILFFLSTLAAFGLASITQKPTKEKPTKEKPTKEKPTKEKPTKEKPPQEGEHISRLAAAKSRLAATKATTPAIVPSAIISAAIISAAIVSVIGIAAAFWYFSEPARNNGHSGAVGRAFALAVIAAAVVVAVVMLARRHQAVRRYAVVVVSLVAAVEILVLAVPFWPNTDPALHYPTTEAHEFLFDQGANDRIATHDLTLYSGTTGYYGLRTVSGHSFHWPTWRDMLVAVDPLAEDWNDTFTILDFNDQQRMRSPILDRLAVRWIVNPLHIPPAGVPVQLGITQLSTAQLGTEPQPAIPAGGAPEAQVSVPAGESLSLTVPSQPLRGVSFYLSEALHAREIGHAKEIGHARETGSATAAYLRVEVATSRGEVISSQRRVPESLGPGWPWIPVAGENIAPGGEMTITVSLETGSSRASSEEADSSRASSDDTDSSRVSSDVLSLGTSAQGELALFIMQPEDANLRLAHVSGVAIWENLDAMKRIRFAPQAVSEPDAAERLKWLTQDATGDTTAPGTQDQTIVLSEQLPRPNSPSNTQSNSPSNTQSNSPSNTQSNTSSGEIVSVKDTFDELAITVESDGPGYVVVADALQHGWTATVNGEAAEVLDADHAVVAIAVAAGTSLVELSYHPPRLALGLTVSAISLVILLLLVLAPKLLARTKPPRAKPRGHRRPRANEKSLAPPPQTSTLLETPPADQTSSKP